MMLPREKLQVVMIFLGIFCCVFGFVLLDPLADEKTEISPPVHKWGFWKDGGITKEGARGFAPWVIGIGVVAFAIASVVRERE